MIQTEILEIFEIAPEQQQQQLGLASQHALNKAWSVTVQRIWCIMLNRARASM